MTDDVQAALVRARELAETLDYELDILAKRCNRRALERVCDTCEAQAQEIARLTETVERQKPFLAFWCKIRERVFEGISDADVEEWAIEVGLLIEARYDPTVHGDCEADPGDTIYIDAPWMAAVLAEPK